MFKRLEEGLTMRTLSSYEFDEIQATVEGKDIFSASPVNKDDSSNDTLVAYKSKTGYDFYYNRLQLHIINTEDLFGVELFVCSADHAWGDGVDSPNADKFRVYSACKQRLLTGRFTDDEVYISGSWNKYVRENFKKLVECIEECKACVKFENIFKTVA